MKYRALTPIVFVLSLFWASGGAAQVLYRLPWPEGRTFMFGQAPGGMITTHVTRDSVYAIDIPMPEGTPVLAARAGVVESAEWRHGSGELEDPLTASGNYVRVRHADGTIATYAHLRYAGVFVVAGEAVEAGRLLGYSGTTGFSTGPHLHFGVTRPEGAASRAGPARGGVAPAEVSVPVTFYVGDPPIPFAARAALIVTADYSPGAERPRAPSEPKPLVPWKRRVLSPEELWGAWEALAACVAAAVAGMVWFWNFSRS